MGRTNYEIDPNLTFIDIFFILSERFIQALRGLCIKPFLKRSKGILFVGKRVKLKSKSRISLGKSVIIGDNVEINALIGSTDAV
jgi:hypothetical protein